MSIFVKISVMNAEESPESQAMKSTTMTIDELVHYLIQWTIYDIYQAGPSQRSSNRLRAKTSKGSPSGPYRYILHACKIKLPEHVVAKMVYGTDVADDV